MAHKFVMASVLAAAMLAGGCSKYGSASTNGPAAATTNSAADADAVKAAEADMLKAFQAKDPFITQSVWDTLQERRNRGRVAQSRAMVDIVGAEAGAHELLEQIGFFI